METFVLHKDLNKKYLESCIYQLLYTITQVCVKRRNVHLCLKIKFIFTQHGTPDHKIVRSSLASFPNSLLAAEEPDKVGHLILILMARG